MNYYALLPLMSAIVNVFLWTFVFALHNRTLSKKVYLVFVAFCACWGLFDFAAWSHQDTSVQYGLLRISSIAWISLTPLYLYFAYLLTDRPVDWILQFIGITTLMFTATAVCTDLIVKDIEQTHWGVVMVPGRLYYLTIIASVILPGVYSIHLIGKKVVRSKGIVKKQLQFFLTGISCTWSVIIIINVVLVILLEQSQLPSLGSTIVCLQAIVVFIASTRYRFLNVGIQEVAIDIFSKASDGVVLLDYNGRIIEINEAAQKMMGISPKHTLSTYIEDLIPKPYGFKKNLENLEIDFQNRKSEDVRLGLLSQCNFYQGNVWAGKLITIKNITVRKDAEQAKRIQAALTAKLQKSQEMKMVALGELASEIVHNFNNLMSGIVGYASILRRKLKGNDELLTLLDGISRTVENAASMGKDIISFSKTDEQPHQIVDIHQSITNCIGLARHSFNDNIEFSLELNASQSEVLAAEADIENLVLNMCINAKDAMPEGGKISIRTQNTFIAAKSDEQFPQHQVKMPNSKNICLTISDTGQGIDPVILDRIFEPFFTTKKHNGGTGLGLSNAYGIVKKLNGNISVESQPYCGTTFTMSFPANTVQATIPVITKSVSTLEK